MNSRNSNFGTCKICLKINKFKEKCFLKSVYISFLQSAAVRGIYVGNFQLLTYYLTSVTSAMNSFTKYNRNPATLKISTHSSLKTIILYFLSCVKIYFKY